MKGSRFSSLRGFKEKRFSGLRIRFLDLVRDWPVSIAHEIIPANGRNLAFVRHERTAEFVHILGGGGKAEVGERSFPVRVGDSLMIPPGVKHRFVTEKKPLVALSVFSPPMTFENLDALACPAPGTRRK